MFDGKKERFNLFVLIHLKQIQHGFAFVCSCAGIRHTSSKGKLTDRLTNTCVFEQQYEVETSFTFKGTFTVKAEDADMAREMVSQLCSMRLGDAMIDVHTPFDEIVWNFIGGCRSNAEVGNVTAVKQSSEEHAKSQPKKLKSIPTA